MLLKTIYEDDNLLVVEKPAGIDIEGIKSILPEGFIPAHRLDKDTSGVLVVAKDKNTLEFLQKQFQERKVGKKYLCLVEGEIKEKERMVETLLGRAPGDRRKQKVYLPGEPKAGGKRQAKTIFKVVERLKGYTLLEAEPKTGRKHQIRSQLAYLGYPVAGDKLYGFKNQKIPSGLKRHFLHASYLKIKLPTGEKREFISPLPEDLKEVLQNLRYANSN